MSEGFSFLGREAMSDVGYQIFHHGFRRDVAFNDRGGAKPDCSTILSGSSTQLSSPAIPPLVSVVIMPLEKVTSGTGTWPTTIGTGLSAGGPMRMKSFEYNHGGWLSV